MNIRMERIGQFPVRAKRRSCLRFQRVIARRAFVRARRKENLGDLTQMEKLNKSFVWEYKVL